MVSFTEAFQTFYALRRDREQRKERARLGLADIGEEGRQQQEHEDTRRRDLFETLLTAFSKGEEHINELYPDDPEGQFNARRQLYDQTLAAMAPLGATPEELEQVGNIFVETPGFASQMLSGLRSSGSENELQYAPRAVINPETDRAIYVAPGEEVGMEPAPESIRQSNTRLREEELNRRRDTDDPDYQGRRSESIEAGRQRARAETVLPNLRRVIGEIDQTINGLLDNPDLEAVTGMPTMRGITRGGLGGVAPPVPGSPAAGALVQLKRLADQTRLRAYETLRGAGQITEAESLFGANAEAALDRINSYDGLVAELNRYRSSLRTALNSAEERARIGRSEDRPRRGVRNPSQQPRRSSNVQSPCRDGESTNDCIERCASAEGC